MKKPLIIIAGPTAVGKTEISINFAKAIGGEIISADSVQVYKKLNIGSAKIKSEEMDGIRHHLIDILEPDYPFNVADFQMLVKKAIEDIYSRGKIPVMVGGTGFYIQAILRDIDFSEGESDSDIRKGLESLATERGQEFLHNMLAEIDPESAETIPAGNVKRVIRAIEYYKVTGEKISVHNARESLKESPYDFRFFVLNDDRENLYKRIDKRVDIMMEQGLLDEVKGIFNDGLPRECVSMQSLGYRQLYEYLYNECTLDEAVYQIKLQTRHFAKRQITWFKREKDVIWVNKNEFEYNENEILKYMLDRCRELSEEALKENNNERRITGNV